MELLPRTSAYAQAMATDEELAKQLLSFPEADRTGKWSRSHRDYSPEVEMLSALFDRIGELIRVVAATKGSRGKQPMLAPRPISALEKVRARAAREKHERLAARIKRQPPPGQ